MKQMLQLFVLLPGVFGLTGWGCGMIDLNQYVVIETGGMTVWGR